MFQYGACGRLSTLKSACPLSEQVMGAFGPDTEHKITANVWYNNQVMSQVSPTTRISDSNLQARLSTFYLFPTEYNYVFLTNFFIIIIIIGNKK